MEAMQLTDTGVPTGTFAHRMSCEKEPFKQGYISNNFPESVLYVKRMLPLLLLLLLLLLLHYCCTRHDYGSADVLPLLLHFYRSCCSYYRLTHLAPSLSGTRTS